MLPETDTTCHSFQVAAHCHAFVTAPAAYMAAMTLIQSHTHTHIHVYTSLHSAANWITTFSICCIFYTVIKLNLQRASSKTFVQLQQQIQNICANAISCQHSWMPLCPVPFIQYHTNSNSLRRFAFNSNNPFCPTLVMMISLSLQNILWF